MDGSVCRFFWWWSPSQTALSVRFDRFTVRTARSNDDDDDLVQWTTTTTMSKRILLLLHTHGEKILTGTPALSEIIFGFFFENHDNDVTEHLC